jgi:hypothetical protein
MLVRAARELGPLLDTCVFVGGSVIGVITGGSARRATKDVDLVAPATSVSEYETDVAQPMRREGWSEDSSEGAPRCRWVHRSAGIADVMSLSVDMFGFNARWLQGVVESAERVELEPGLTIRVASLPYFLATKVEAFQDRGENDWQASPDLEDILTVVAGRADSVQVVDDAEEDVRAFLIETFSKWASAGGLLGTTLGSRLGGPGPLVIHAQSHFDGDATGAALADLAVQRLDGIGRLQPLRR